MPILESLFNIFVLSVLIVTQIFLTNFIRPHRKDIPGFNDTMFNFIWISLWIIIGFLCVVFLVVTAAQIAGYDYSEYSFPLWYSVLAVTKKPPPHTTQTATRRKLAHGMEEEEYAFTDDKDIV